MEDPKYAVCNQILSILNSNDTDKLSQLYALEEQDEDLFLNAHIEIGKGTEGYFYQPICQNGYGFKEFVKTKGFSEQVYFLQNVNPELVPKVYLVDPKHHRIYMEDLSIQGFVTMRVWYQIYGKNIEYSFTKLTGNKEYDKFKQYMIEKMMQTSLDGEHVWSDFNSYGNILVTLEPENFKVKFLEGKHPNANVTTTFNRMFSEMKKSPKEHEKIIITTKKRKLTKCRICSKMDVKLYSDGNLIFCGEPCQRIHYNIVQNKFKFDALAVAVGNNNTVLVEQLLEQQGNYDLESAIRVGIIRNALDSVRILLEHMNPTIDHLFLATHNVEMMDLISQHSDITADDIVVEAMRRNYVDPIEYVEFNEVSPNTYFQALKYGMKSHNGELLRFLSEQTEYVMKLLGNPKLTETQLDQILENVLMYDNAELLKQVLKDKRSNPSKRNNVYLWLLVNLGYPESFRILLNDKRVDPMTRKKELMEELLRDDLQHYETRKQNLISLMKSGKFQLTPEEHSKLKAVFY